MSGVAGMLTKLGIGVNATVDYRLDFQNENLKANEEIVNGNGIRGTRSHDISRVRPGIVRIGGTVNLIPNSVELSYILPWAFGGSPTGSGNVAYPLGETLSEMYVAIDRVAKVPVYGGVKVARFSMDCRQGEPLHVGLQLIGVNETVGSSGSFPSLNIDTTTGPFVFMDCTIDVAGTTITPSQFSFEVNNMIDPNRFFNSRYATALIAHDREVTYRVEVPYGDFSALYNTGNTGVSVNMTFTNGGAILGLHIPKLVFPREAAAVPGRREVMMPIGGRCYKSGSNQEFNMTLAVGP